MKQLLFFLIMSFFIMEPACSQPPASRPAVVNQEFDKELTRLLNFSVPIIGVEELRHIQDEVYIFDAREQEEYNVSHIDGAAHLGYRQFDKEKLKEVPKDARVILYCSVGYRSEKIGEKLREMGYENVSNLYGSIFEWVNQGYPIVDQNGKPTQKLHTYNSKWSKWVDNHETEKVW
ncbi:MAG: rhodanese-like domain-containing protein [Phaeodactylibacter sp.]|nr:rhodanese-like domain-containing protein [Phaeodactylibacter sp.]